MTLTRAMIASVKKAMSNAGIPSEAQLAREIGMRNATVNEILNGKRDPRLSTLKKMAKACNCTVSQLIGE